MSRNRVLGLVFGAAVFLVPLQSVAASLLVDPSGTLLGATEVTIGKRVFEVFLRGGNCNSVFDGCSEDAFAFDDSNEALAAAQALLDQVYIDGPDGNFDTEFNIAGCSKDYFNCFTRVPYKSVAPASYLMATAFNTETNDFTALEGPFTNDNGPFLNLNFSEYRPVPLPATLPLAVIAFGALAAWSRKRGAAESRLARVRRLSHRMRPPCTWAIAATKSH